MEAYLILLVQNSNERWTGLDSLHRSRYSWAACGHHVLAHMTTSGQRCPLMYGLSLHISIFVPPSGCH